MNNRVEHWYRQSAKAAAEALHVDVAKGLSDKEAEHRLEVYGRNELEAGRRINPIALFFSQFKDVLVIVLLAAALVSLGVTWFEEQRGGNGLAALPQGECVLSRGEGEAGRTAQIDTSCLSVQQIGELGLSGEETLPASLRLCETGEGYRVCDEAVTVHEEEAEYTESILIFAIVIAIAIIGFLNEYKAERTVEALRKLVGSSARVRRGGQVVEIPADELVPGDIILLEEGQKIPADIRLYQVKALQVNESSLTGESVPVSKNTYVVDKDAALGDQKNMAFSGTIVTTGTAEGIVVSTGGETEIGKIAGLVNEVEDEETPMQKKLDELGRRLGLLVLAICAGVFVIVFFVNPEADVSTVQRIIFAFTVAVALAVAAIPEGLSFVVRISLALGARRMASKNALVRKLSAVEALGSTDVICSDKTGTLTRGEMTVRAIWTGGGLYEVNGSGYSFEGEFTEGGKKLKSLKPLETLLRLGVLCNNAHIKDGHVIGDPTEGSLLVSGAKAGFDHDKTVEEFKRVDELPFTSERKMMSTVHRHAGGHLVASKGAPDVLLDHCSKVLINGRVRNLTKEIKADILKENARMASQALRVLGFAYKEEKLPPKASEAEKDLIFAGLQGMMDPPREEVKEVMHRIHAEAGMRVLMITGDYIETAKAVAKEIGIRGGAISGSELDAMTQEEFERQVEHISVYARVNPEHKIRIVQALKKHGHQVAMTGDGVNDAPAIKAADIGIAMGINGTDAAKEAADLILLDDQFLTIISAVEEGRGIFDNVRKFVSYLLGANIAEIFIVVGGIVFLQDPILTATQLLFINIVTDGLPAVALGSDPAEKGIMRFKPQHFQTAIINRRVWIEMTTYGLVMTAYLLWHFAYVQNTGDHIEAVSAALTALVVYELVRLIALRTNYNISWFSNPWLTVALVSSFLAHMAIMFIPALADLFGIIPINARDWWLIALGSVLVFFTMKAANRLVNRFIPDVKPQRHAA